MSRISCLLTAVLSLVYCLANVPLAYAGENSPECSKRLAIVPCNSADETAARIADAIKARIEERCTAAIAIGATEAAGADLTIYLGTPADDPETAKRCEAHGVTLPGRTGAAPEGFALKTFVEADRPAVLVAGADRRGMLYGAGELLRRMRYLPDGVALGDVDMSSAPAYRIRGSSANQGGTMIKITGARPWTREELRHCTLDLALSGANCFYAYGGMLEYVKAFDLMAETGCRPNQLPNPLKEWHGTELGDWVCPSIPAAHEALLTYWDDVFAKRGNYDVLRFFAGDPGGCRCERCQPWGKTFIHLCEELGELWLKHHPGTTVLAANQDLDNAGDQAIFDYLNEAPRPWLYGLAYGPGSNAMSRYFRHEQRDDLFTYPGDGPINRYLAETLHQLPAQQHIVHYSDITHWISAQYQVEHPDPYIEGFYGRRTFHTRPRAFYRIFQAIMPFSEGDIIYSEGYHDEFHQFMWNRLLWNPNQSLDDVTLEYCRYCFGEDAADLMKEALYQLEENLETPFADNQGIGRYYDLVSEAGDHIPPHLMAGNHRWRLHKQHAALDKYLQLKVRRALEQQARIQQAANRALNGGRVNQALQDIQAILAEPAETEEMGALRAEAGRLGDESNELFGVRDIGYFSLDYRLRNIASLKRLADKAAEAATKDDKEKALAEIAAYAPSGNAGLLLKK